MIDGKWRLPLDCNALTVLLKMIHELSRGLGRWHDRPTHLQFVP